MVKDERGKRKRASITSGRRIPLVLSSDGEEFLQKYDILNNWLANHKARYEDMKNALVSRQIADMSSNELLDDVVVGVYNVIRAIAILVRLPSGAADYILPLVKQITKELGENMCDMRENHKEEFEAAMKSVREYNLAIIDILRNQVKNGRVQLFNKDDQLVLLDDLGVGDFEL